VLPEHYTFRVNFPQLILVNISISWNGYLSPRLQNGGFYSLQMLTLDEKHSEALADKNSDGVIQRLRDALKNKSVIHEPWTSGVFTLPESKTTLFYQRQDGSST